MDVPQELARLPQWILWRYAGPERRKIPYQVNGQHARSNDPSTWSTLDAAQAALTEYYAGLGFVFAADDGLFGIDLDGCIGADGQIASWASQVLAEFPTYAEVSPSGTGIKLWARGKLPWASGKKRSIHAEKCCDKEPAIELYDHGRYFCFTGRRLPESPLAVVDCQPALESLVNRFWPAQVPTRPAVSTDITERAARYLDTIPPAVSGQGGHNVTFHAACSLVLGFQLSPEDAYPLLAAWNERCQPPWSERELWHKLRQADAKTDTRGYLLNGSGQQNGTPVNLGGLLELPEPEVETPEPEIEMPDCVFQQMPKLMRLAYDWVLATAIKPQPLLTLGSLIALFGTVFGRRVRDDYGTRTNVMVLAIAPSGSGKEHPRQRNKQLLLSCGLDRTCGPERVGSHAGIITAVAAHHVQLLQLDEIGRLLATMRDARAAPHLYNVATVLMQLYSSAGTLWVGDAYADAAKTKRVDQPCLCVFGTSAPENFYGSISAENLSDGLLGRMLVFETPDNGSKRRKPTPVDSPPELLVEELKAWCSSSVGGNLEEIHPQPLLVPKTAEADERHEQHCQDVDNRHSDEDAAARALWSRTPEKSAKLALIFAMCHDWREPRITLEAVNWGRQVANYSTRLLLRNARAGIAESQYERDKKRLWSRIKNGMTVNELTRASQWLRSRDREAMLSDMVEIGAIALEKHETGKRPKTVIRRLRGVL